MAVGRSAKLQGSVAESGATTGRERGNLDRGDVMGRQGA